MIGRPEPSVDEAGLSVSCGYEHLKCPGARSVCMKMYKG